MNDTNKRFRNEHADKPSVVPVIPVEPLVGFKKGDLAVVGAGRTPAEIIARRLKVSADIPDVREKREPAKQPEPGRRFQIQAAQLEFVEGGNTIWIHAPDGSTILRIKTTGKVASTVCDVSPSAHGDILVKEDITLCIPENG